MEKFIEEYLIGVNADRSSTDAQKQTIAQHLKAFVKLIASKSATQEQHGGAEDAA